MSRDTATLQQKKQKRDTATFQQKKKAKNMKGNSTKSNKTPGNAVTHSTLVPNKNKTWKRKATPTKHPNPKTSAGKFTPAGNNNATTFTNKKHWKNTGRKSGGRREWKPTAARN